MKAIRPLPAEIRPRWETPDPPGVIGTYGDQVIAWGTRRLGLTLGPWQAYALRKALRYGANGDLLHRIVLLSTARQNGKSVVVRSFFGWLLDEGWRVLPFSTWSTLLAAAHDAKQARIVYRGVMNDLAPFAKAENIRLTQYFGIESEGLLFDTVTSQPGSARGLSAGAIAWDEMMTQRDWGMYEALSPTQSAQRSPIMVLTSTAGLVDSVILRAFYDRMVRIASGDEAPDPTFYAAWWQSKDPDARWSMPELRRANPALSDGRMSLDAIRTEHRILPDASWRRERMNHFVDEVAVSAFRPGVFAACRAPGPLDGVAGPFTLAVDVSPGWQRATITASALRPDGRVGVVVYRDILASPSEPITAQRLIDLVNAFPEPFSTVVYDSVSGAAGEFGRHAEQAWGVEWKALKPSEVVAACMDVTEMILAGKLAVDDRLLDAQIAGVVTKPVGQEGAFRFSRALSTGPVDGVFAMTFAVHTAASVAAWPTIG